MVKRERIGSASIGVGAFILGLGIIFIVLTVLDITPNQSWMISGLTNYILCGVGVVIGALLLGYGAYMRGALSRYARRVETLSEARAEQSQKLRQKTISLKETEAELERKETALRLTKGKLRTSRGLAERRTEQMYRTRGKLGDRSKRLKRIEKLAKVKKRKK